MINKPTVLTLKNGYGQYYITVDHTDLSLVDMMDLVRRLLLAAGYQPDNINEYIPED